jgi:phospholipid/cholesterol/gamma-HCH transport system substrate-binding protein
MRRAALALALAVLATALAACAPSGGLLVRAEFADVADLVERASVKIADVPVGTVTEIELTEDHTALVTMRLDERIELPSEVGAELRKTSVLGERYVRLVPDREAGGSYEPGSVIQDTRFIPELEELVGSGTELLAAVATDRLAAAIDAGAEGLEGRGATFGALLDDLGVVIDAYEDNSGDIVRLIDGLEQFLSVTGPQAELHGVAFAELAQATAVLRAEDDRLLDTLVQVRSLSSTGADIIRTHRERFDRFFSDFGAVLHEVAGKQADLDRLFFELAKHNRNTIRGVHDEHAQVLLDFIVCGVNDSPGDNVRACSNPPQGRPRPDVPADQGFGR